MNYAPKHITRREFQAFVDRLEARLSQLEQVAHESSNPQDPPYYSIREFSQLTGLSKGAVLMRIKRGTLRAMQKEHYGMWWIDAGELDRFTSPDWSRLNLDDMYNS